MNTPLIESLLQHLASINSEQFQAEWSEVEAMGFDDLPIEEFLKTLITPQAIAQIKSPLFSPLKFNEVFSSTVEPEFTYADAA
jgi:hypothetical protein